jgi:hypothetical protein
MLFRDALQHSQKTINFGDKLSFRDALQHSQKTHQFW